LTSHDSSFVLVIENVTSHQCIIEDPNIIFNEG